MSGIGVNLRVTGHCSQGGRKYMEDMFSVAYQQTVDLKDLEYAFFGIFDGHGGHQAASFAKEHLLDSIVNQRNFWSEDDEDVLRAIRDGYIATHYAMWKNLEKWPRTTTGLPSTSGSTATVAFIMKGKIYIGHVGDTAIVLGYQEDGIKEWKARVLTKDHKPESKEEKQRIEQSGGKVVNKSGVPRVVWNRPRPGHQGPVRRSTPIDEIPFLAVARSLGDFWSYNSALDQFVVSPEPDVLVYPVDVLRFRCLVLGTDGLWNMMTPERAVTIVQATELHNEKQVIYGLNNKYNKEWLNPSKTLVDRALDRWVTTKLRADNTSVVTLLLDPPGPPRSQVLRKQLKKWRGETSKTEEENDISVPKSGGLAIFTHYPPEESDKPLKEKPDAEINIEDSENTPIEKIQMEKNDNNSVKVEENEEIPCSSAIIISNPWRSKDGSPLKEPQSLKRSSNILNRTRSEEKSCKEEASSDAENERVFPDIEPKKRRLSLDKKSSKPDSRRRPSLPALNGKTSSLCKTRSLEESTRMLRSATPIKTLRSRNIDLSDLSSNTPGKRSLTQAPPTNKKPRMEEKHTTSSSIKAKRKPHNKAEVKPTKTCFLKSYLESEENSEPLYGTMNSALEYISPAGDKKDDHEGGVFSKKLVKDRKHKSTSPSMLSCKWKEPFLEVADFCNAQSASDSELSCHKSRLQEDCASTRLTPAPALSPPRPKITRSSHSTTPTQPPHHSSTKPLQK